MNGGRQQLDERTWGGGLCALQADQKPVCGALDSSSNAGPRHLTGCDAVASTSRHERCRPRGAWRVQATRGMAGALDAAQPLGVDAEHHPADAAPEDGGGAHRTGLGRCTECGVGPGFAGELAAQLPQRVHFSVACRVAELGGCAIRIGQQHAVGPGVHRPKGVIAARPCGACPGAKRCCLFRPVAWARRTRADRLT